MKVLSWVVLFTICLLSAASPSWATPLAAGGTVVGAGDSFTVTGTVVADTGVQAYSFTVGGFTISGQYESQVYSDPGNSFCAGCLDFLYAVSSTGNDAIYALSASSFVGFLTDVGWANNLVVGGYTNIPVNDEITRSGNGSSINFKYNGNGVPNGDSTQVLVIETNATVWTAGQLSIQDDANGTVGAFAPTVPEPASLLLLGTVLAFVVRSLRKRFTV